MKMLLSTLALFVVLASNAFAANCPNFSGKYYDYFGFYNILTQEGCSAISWTLDNNPATPGFEPSLPKTHAIIIDGKDHILQQDIGANGRVVYESAYYAYFANDALIISWRKNVWHKNVWTPSYSREILTTDNGAKPIITQLEKDLVDEEEFRSTNVDRSFHRQWFYKTQQFGF